MKIFIFDMDDTLYLRSEPFVRACREQFPACASYPAEQLYAVRKKHSDFSFREFTEGRMSQEEMYVYRTVHTFEEFSIALSKEEALAFEALYADMLNQISLHPVMIQILKFLQQEGALIGIITNGPAGRQRDKLRALHIDQWIPAERCIISGEVGIEKPDPQIFRLAEERFSISGKDAWYIGDSYDADIVGARAAGWHTIWLCHDREAASCAENQTGHVVFSYESLKSLIQYLVSPL